MTRVLTTDTNTKTISARVDKKTKNIQVEVKALDQDIEVGIAEGIISAFSPTVTIEELESGNFLITITDRTGTTTAEIPILSEEMLNAKLIQYFEHNPVILDYIREHNLDVQSHPHIRNVLSEIINLIPTKISELDNDEKYIKNIHEMLVEYDSYYHFPNIPTEKEKKMIFLDKSTGDMYVFGLNNSLTYTSIGFSNQDLIDGGDSTS